MFELDRIAESLKAVESSVASIVTRLTLIEAQIGTYRRRETVLAKVLASTVAVYVLYRLTGIVPR